MISDLLRELPGDSRVSIAPERWGGGWSMDFSALLLGGNVSVIEAWSSVCARVYDLIQPKN